MVNKIKLILLFLILFVVLNCDILNFFKKEKKDFYHQKINNPLIVDSVFLCSEKFKIKPELIISIVSNESGFNVNGKNYNDNGTIDYSLMGLNSATFKDLSIDQFYDIECNIFNGTKYLAEKLKEFQGNEVKAICAYNCGSWVVNKSKIPQSTLNYVNAVIKYKYELEIEFLESKK